MNETKSVGLRLPVQASVDRPVTGAALAEDTGVEASQNWSNILQGALPIVTSLLGSLF